MKKINAPPEDDFNAQLRIKEWLIAKWKRPNGTVRKDSPFGPMEEKILDDFYKAETTPDGHKVSDHKGNYFMYKLQSGKIVLIDVSYKNDNL